MKWEDRSALVKIAQYPRNKDLHVTEKTLIHLLNLHGFSKEAGMTTLTVKDVNIITYYSGKKLNYYIILVLNMLENVEDFEYKLEEIAVKLLENIKNLACNDMLPELYEKFIL